MNGRPSFEFGKMLAVLRPGKVAEFDVDLLVERPGQVGDGTKRKLSSPAEIAVKVSPADADHFRQPLLGKSFFGPPFENGGNEVAADISGNAAGRARARAYFKPK